MDEQKRGEGLNWNLKLDIQSRQGHSRLDIIKQGKKIPSDTAEPVAPARKVPS